MWVISIHRVAAVSESLIQSNGMTSQRIPARPSLAATASTAGSVRPPGGRHRVGVTPVASRMACCAFDNWSGTNSAGIVVIFGCSQVWLPISMPASATRLAPAGSAATLLPIMKNVARAPASSRI